MTFPRILLTVVLSVLSTVACADFAKGQEAIARKDYAVAGTEFEGAAKSGNRDAMAALGSMFASGLGVGQDYARAFEWYLKAAEAGQVGAQGALARMYATGTGAAKNDKQSLFWARRAAEAGDAASQYIMGVRSAQGLGIKRDSGQALLWFGAAAEQGVVAAQYSLGFLMTQGAASLKDEAQAKEFRRQAFKWLLIAKRGGNVEADAGLAGLRSLLTADDIAKAETEAAVWQPPGGVASANAKPEKQ